MAEKKITKRHAGMWKPGQSGNPKGRPSRAKETRYLQIMHDVVDDKTWALICARAAKDALDGSHPARRWLGDYMVGPPIKQSELTISGDVSLSGPSLDRRVKLIAAQLVAVLVLRDGEQEISIPEGDIIEGTIIENDGNDEETV